MCILGVKKAKGNLGCIRQQVERVDVSPLLSPGEVHVACCVQFWAPPYTRR